MQPDVTRADAPLFLKRLIAPLPPLLGVPLMVRESATAPDWPDPGQAAHAILHREFPERGACPHLENESFLPLDGQPPAVDCPLGLTTRRFAIHFDTERQGVLILGPFFIRESDRTALAGRSRAADAALALLPALERERLRGLQDFCQEVASFADSAAQAGAVKETFLANMSHELRTPLNGIMGMLSLVLQGDMSPRQRQFLDLAMDASQQLLSLVNGLLEMTTISAGNLLLTAAPFNLRQELQPLFTACADEAAQQSLTFSATIDADIPETLVGDAPHIRQILSNLIHNALKCTETGSVAVHVSRPIEKPTPGTVTLFFAVRDTGIGIPPERQHHIFDRFSIGEDFLHKRYGRTGIGLAISKEIVEKMGGSMRLESTPGAGSVFSFTAVLRHGGTAAYGTQLPPAAQGRGAEILFLGEEPVSRLLVRRILENQGYTPIVADSGRMLLDTLRGGQGDLVLLDLQAPHPDALDLIRRIRAGQEPNVLPGIPILALTPPAANAALQPEGLTGRVAKPVTRQELLAAVELALPRKKVEQFS